MSQASVTPAAGHESHRNAWPSQAVILAGGRGARLRPLTDTVPKPMIRFHGKPFLEYLIEMLREEGFSRVLLLLGYMPEVVRGYFGSGERWGVEIDYSVSPEEDETGRRVKRAEHLLDQCFLLMYCDNYWPVRIDDMWQRFVHADMPAMVTVYSNDDGHSRDNVRVDRDSHVVIYDKNRRMAGLQGVEIGFGIMTKPVLKSIPDENVSFEKVVYSELVAKRQLLAYVTHHRYYSVGSHERLPQTEAFLARHPAVFIDRDGVLNKKTSKARYIRTWNEFEWLPGAREALALLKRAGYQVIIVSNQAGVARGAVSEAALANIHERMKEEALEAGGHITDVYHCPHDWDEGCWCRKPKPGMLFQAQRDHDLDLSRTPFIGDDERDGQAAVAAGCPPLIVREGTSLLDYARQLVDGRLDEKADGPMVVREKAQLLEEAER